ncbi:MAG: hypothetical protein ACSHXZ_06655 [Gammaproteobacteria bacterium]
MYTKIILAILLVFNHSLLFGAIQAAEMPDECHPNGHNSPLDHPGQMSSKQHALVHIESGTSLDARADCLEHDLEHDEHHEHGMHIHLSLSLTDTLEVPVQIQAMLALPPYQMNHQFLSYTPPVPPPTV